MRLNPTRRLSHRTTTASLIVLTGCLILATPALAQQRVSNPGDGRTPGMRYLTWPGKNESPRASRTVTTPSAPPEYQAEPAPEIRNDAEPRGPILSMPSQPLVAPVATRYSARTSPGPTPASAWITNGGIPTSAPRVYSEPTYAPPAYDPTPRSTFVPAPPLETAVRAGNVAPSYDARVATLPEPPRGYAPVVPLDAPTPRADRVIDAPAYAAPTYEAPPVEQPRYAPPRDGRPVAADTGPAAEAPRPAPIERRMEQPSPAPVSPLVEAPASTPAVDPYAPRADAPIFRMLNRNSQPAPVPEQPAPQPSPAPTSAAPTGRTASPDPQQTAQAASQTYPAAPTDVDRSPRRYSVHRGNGQSPDRVPLPDPVMLDSAPVDLAEPPEAPTVVRNVNGRLTAITPASGDPAQP